MASTAPLGAGIPATRSTRPPAEQFMRRLLRVPERRPALSEDTTNRLFSFSILLSATRCLLSYILLPIITPLVGAATSVGPDVGIPLSVVALYFDVKGVRRFWLADHRWRWQMTAIYVAVMGLVLALLGLNIATLVG